MAAGIWTADDFAPAIPANGALEYDGEGEASGDWLAVTEASICSENTGTVSSTEILNLSNEQVYPNPASDELNIVNVKVGTRIELISSDGRAMKSIVANGEEVRIDVSSFPYGMYIIRTSLEDELRIAKVVIN